MTAQTTIGLYGTKTSSTAAFSTEEFTPPANCLLLVRVFAIRDGGESEMGVPTIEGGGLTYTARGTATTTLKAAWSTKGVWFTAPVGSSPAKMKITVDDLNNLKIYEWDVSVIAITNYNVGSPIGGILGSGTTNIGDGEESRELSEAPATIDLTFLSIDVDSSKGPPKPALEAGWALIHEKSLSGESGIAIAIRENSTSKTVKVKDVYVGGGIFSKGGLGAIVIRGATTSARALPIIS